MDKTGIYFNCHAERVDAEKGHFFRVLARVENDTIINVKCEGDNILFIKEMCLNLEKLVGGMKKNEVYKIKISDFYPQKDAGTDYAEALLLTLLDAVYPSKS